MQSTTQQQMKSGSIYDKIYHLEMNYNPKAHRDDRQHSKFIGLFQIEQVKDNSVVKRSSNEYGFRHDKQIDFNEKRFVKVEHIRNEFYRNNGVLH